jgi:hypothetical protein
MIETYNRLRTSYICIAFKFMTDTHCFVDPEIRETLIFRLDRYNTSFFQRDTDVQNLIRCKNPLQARMKM